MLDSYFKSLKLNIQYVGKEKTQLIVGEYDEYVLFPFLVCAYKTLNSIANNDVVPLLWTILKVHNCMTSLKLTFLHGGKFMNHNLLMLLLWFKRF